VPFPVPARELVEAARAGEIAVIDYREGEIERTLQLLEGRRSVLLTGPDGAGKTAVIHGVAHAMARGDAGVIYELSTSLIMSGTKYLGEWQTRIIGIADSAEKSGAVLYITDVWNLPRVGRWSGSDENLFDALRPYLEGRRIRILAEASSDVLPLMQRERGFIGLFENVAVLPLSAERVDDVLRLAAERAGLAADEPTRRALVDLTARFTPSRPQPGPALNLLRQVLDYQAQKRAIGEAELVSPEFVEKVFSIYSGLPRFVVSRTETKPAHEIRDWFRERLVGQVDAIDAVVEAIALFKAGLHDPNRPIGTFLFVGPTGVGKTELARALAEFLFGSSTRLLRFDLSEFKDYNSISTLIGDPDNPKTEARLVDPVRAQPFQVVLFDELEKAHSNVWDLLLPLLDEGRLTPPSGQTVNFRNTLLIATSNVGAAESGRSVGFGGGVGPISEGGRADRIRDALERVFRPELLNRFQHIAVFHSLSREQVRVIAKHELKRVLGRQGITARNLVVDVADDALDLVIERGFDQRYGARALKRQIQSDLVLPLAMMLMERRVDPGSILKLGAREGKIRVVVHDTEAARAVRREMEPVKLPDGEKLGRAEVREKAEVAADAIEQLAMLAGETGLRAERDRLGSLRQAPEFWSQSDESARVLRDLDRVTARIARIDGLRARAEAIAESAPRAQLRREVQDLANRLAQLDDALAVTRRELVSMGAGAIEDALVEVRPIGPGGRPARDLVLGVYLAWAEGRRFRIDWLREPLTDDEPAMIAIRGNYALGYVALEAGLHRVRKDDAHGAACVRVAGWTDAAEPAKFAGHRALKLVGQQGGKVRSRVECEGGLILQNGRTLAENRELAEELVGSWRLAAPAPDAIVRRYDTEPFLVRDILTDTSTGRPETLSPARFHELLCRRIDAAAAV
jgi:ATP-dependent Clp protease ATP-binding subunit ClpC